MQAIRFSSRIFNVVKVYPRSIRITKKSSITSVEDRRSC